MATIYGWEAGRPLYYPTWETQQTQGTQIPEFPVYTPYQGGRKPGFTRRARWGEGTSEFPEFPTVEEYPEVGEFPTYEPGGVGEYPITRLPTYQPTEEAYPEYISPETGGLAGELRGAISERMRGEGTAGAESAIYQRGEERVNEEYEEGLENIDAEMGARGLIGSGIHGEAISKLEEQRQKSLADLSRQVTIYGQEAIESSMAKAQQYVAYEADEAARELATRERGWAGRIGESIRSYESQARAEEVAGRSEEAAFQSAIAEKIRVYEAQAKSWQATSSTSIQKWRDKADLAMQKYQAELQKAQLLMQARQRSNDIAREEYWRAYQSKYQATKDTWLAQQAAQEAAEKKRQLEWERQRREIETQWETYYQRYKVETHRKYETVRD